MTDFLMPSLGADMESGKVVQWLVKPGSTVKKGDVIVLVETHKGTIEVEIFEEGIVAELCVGEGEQVPVGALLARLSGTDQRQAGGAAVGPAGEAPTVAPSVGEKAATSTGTPLRVAAEPATGVRIKVTPVARRRAAEIGIDPATLKGTGIEGSVTLADVEAARSAAAVPAAGLAAAVPVAAAQKPKGGFDPLQMRQAIAAAMSRSKRDIPHYYLSSTIDLGAATAWLEQYNQARLPDERLLPAVLLLKATAIALRDAPQLNGFWENGAFRPGSGIHVGWAISLRGGGLVAPAIHDADRKSLPELMAALRDLVGRARSGGLRSSELMDATITVTSLGERGADSVIGVIYPPQVAIVGFGRIVQRPWSIDGRIEARPLVNVSIAADHRASDGHTGGRLLAAIEQRLQQPEAL